MYRVDSNDHQRACYISICSAKGGVGKSTVALLLAARLAESGKRTLLIDADFGTGDAALLSNAVIEYGFEDLACGEVSFKDAAVKVAARLWLIGTRAGTFVSPDLFTTTGINNCKEIDTLFDVVVIDTPSSIDPLVVELVRGSDLALTVLTPQIAAVADSYTQIKKVTERGGARKHALLINSSRSEPLARQTTEKFCELANRFLGLEVEALGIIAEDPRIAQAAENQALPGLARQSAGVGDLLQRLVNMLQDKYLRKPPVGPSLWQRLEGCETLKNLAAFDDREMVHLRRASDQNEKITTSAFIEGR